MISRLGGVPTYRPVDSYVRTRIDARDRKRTCKIRSGREGSQAGGRRQVDIASRWRRCLLTGCSDQERWPFLIPWGGGACSLFGPLQLSGRRDSRGSPGRETGCVLMAVDCWRMTCCERARLPLIYLYLRDRVISQRRGDSLPICHMVYAAIFRTESRYWAGWND